ncbi:MAG TPA: hypothetical protein PKU69_03295, partial [Bacillota bacterium]|nr:hypothetical protein [Bacillota bacterium]
VLNDSNISDYIVVKDNYRFNFTSPSVEEGGVRSFSVTISPHYQADKMTVDPVTLSFDVIDAYNAFTNEDLQTLYKNMKVDSIVLQANIIAEIDPEYLNNDGSPVNGKAKPITTDTSDYRGNVYQRVGVASSDSLVLNGNYFTIDGTDLPFVNADSDPDGEYTTVGIGDGSTYGVVSVQIAIFYYNVIPDLTYQSINNDNTVSYENLTVLGNTKTPSVNYSLSAEEILYQEELMIQNSGGLCGIMSRSGSMNVNNVNVNFTTIAIFQTSYAYMLNGTTPVTTNVSHFQANDSWANSFYLYGTPMTYISSSVIGESGGAAIHIEDIRTSNSGIDEPTVNISNDTQINNWIAGDEAWFKAYGFSELALMLKSAVETNVNKFDKTIINLVTNSITGTDSEMMNFVLLNRSTGGAESWNEAHTVQLTGSEVTMVVEDDCCTTTINRDFYFANSSDFPYNPATYSGCDPRTQSNSFMFPVGQYSDMWNFLYAYAAAEQQLETHVDPATASAKAGDAVYIAAFYNLTAVQGAEAWFRVASGQSASVYEAVLAITSNTLPAQ